jgi:hypothetical protein
MSIVFKQKKNGNELKFELNENDFNYSAKLGSTKFTRDFSYTAISSKMSEFTEKNEWFRNAGYIWLAIGVIQLISMVSERVLVLPFWFALGAVCLGIYYFRQTKFTIIEADEKNILIIENLEHDKILNSIFEYRNNFIKKEYSQINFNNNPENEINKFSFLFKEKIISEEEFKEAKEKIETHYKNQPIPSPLSML